MLIPFGVLSAAGAGGQVFENAFELIATATGTGASPTITFSSIPQTYKHLELRYVEKNDGTTGGFLRLNGITSSSYARHTLEASGSTPGSGSGTPTSSIFQRFAPSTTVNAFAAGIISILDYSSTTKNTTIRVFAGERGTNSQIALDSGLLNNTAAITSITLTANSSGYETGSRFSLYGIKG
jgi:hypothetical protein